MSQSSWAISWSVWTINQTSLTESKYIMKSRLHCLWLMGSDRWSFFLQRAYFLIIFRTGVECYNHTAQSFTSFPLHFHWYQKPDKATYHSSRHCVVNEVLHSVFHSLTHSVLGGSSLRMLQLSYKEKDPNPGWDIFPSWWWLNPVQKKGFWLMICALGAYNRSMSLMTCPEL